MNSLCKIVFALSVFLALTLLLGCGQGKPDPAREPLESAVAPPPSGEETAALDGESAAADTEKVWIEVRDEEGDAPVVMVKVLLFYTPESDAGRALCKTYATSLRGVAAFDVPPSTRLMVRTALSREDHAFTLDPSGETRVTLRVPTRFEVSGTVLRPDGEGLEGAVVFFAACEPAKAPGSWSMPIPGAGIDLDEFRRRFGYDMKGEAETGADGGFTCFVKTCKPLVAAVYHRDYLCPQWQWIPCLIQESRFESPMFRLYPRARLRVQVLDARNQALAGRFITLFEEEESRWTRPGMDRIHTPFHLILKSGDDGFVEGDVPAGLGIDAEGFLLYQDAGSAGYPDPVRDRPLDAVRLAKGETRTCLAVPPRMVRLSGLVMDGKGDPLKGARMVLPSNTIQTGDDGRFHLLVPYNAYRKTGYLVTRPGFKTESGYLPGIGEDTMELPLEVVLTPSEDLRLAAPEWVESLWLVEEPEESSSEPILKGMEKVLSPNRLEKGTRIGRGAFVFPGIGPGVHTLLVQESRFSFLRLPEVSLESGRSVEDWLERAPAAVEDARLEGKIVLPDSIRPQAMEVTLLRIDLPEVRRWDPLAAGREEFGWASIRADEQGGFQFKDLAPGRYALSAALFEWDHRIDAHAEVTIGPGTNVVTLAPPAPEQRGSLRIAVKNGEGDPQGGICLYLLDPVDSPLAPARGVGLYTHSDPQGIIALDDMQPGRYGLCFSRYEGREPLFEGRAEVKAGTCAEIEIVLP